MTTTGSDVGPNRRRGTKRQRKLILIDPRRPFDIVAFDLVMIITFALSIYGVVSDIRTILAFITIFFIPGYALQAAIFPTGRIWEGNKSVPDFFERIAVSLVLSFLVIGLTITLLIGGLGIVILNLNNDLVTSIVLIVTVLASIIAVDRRLVVPKERAFRVALTINSGSMNVTEKIIAIAIIVLVAVAGINAVSHLDQGNPNTFSSFAIYGISGNISSLPSEIAANSTASFSIMIECLESHGVRYSLTVWMDNPSSPRTEPLDTGNVTALVNGTAFVKNIELASGEKWTQEFRFMISAIGLHKIFLTLDAPGEESKELWLWLTVD